MTIKLRQASGRPARGLVSMTAAAAAAAALVVSLAATSASAAQPGFSAEDAGAARQIAGDTGQPGVALETVAAAYRAAYPDLSVEAARAAAAARGNVEELKAQVLEHPETFGGAWFDPYEGVYHIAVTTAAARSQVAEIGAGLAVEVQTHQVERTFAELETQAEELRHGTGSVAAAADQQVGIDVRTNQVVVAVPEKSLSALRSQAPAGTKLVVDSNQEFDLDVCNSRADCNDSLRAGLVLRRNGSPACSAGFTGRFNGNRWLFTSGHCAGLGATWSTGTTTQTNIGPMTDAIDSGVVDAGAILVTNSTYANNSSGRIYMHNSSGRWVPVDGVAPSMSWIWEGDTTCIAARIAAPATATNPCGTITIVSDPAKRGMVKVAGYDACQGDSGGGWYWLTSGGSRWAYGLHSRSETGCNASPHNSWFSPLPAFWPEVQYELG